MPTSDKLLVIALIIALISLGLSIFTTYSVLQNNKKIAEIDETVTEMEPVMEKFQPLLPQFETLNKFLPRMKQFLQSLPLIPVE